MVRPFSWLQKENAKVDILSSDIHLTTGFLNMHLNSFLIWYLKRTPGPSDLSQKILSDHAAWRWSIQVKKLLPQRMFSFSEAINYKAQSPWFPPRFISPNWNTGMVVSLWETKCGKDKNVEILYGAVGRVISSASMWAPGTVWVLRLPLKRQASYCCLPVGSNSHSDSGRWEQITRVLSEKRAGMKGKQVQDGWGRSGVSILGSWSRKTALRRWSLSWDPNNKKEPAIAKEHFRNQDQYMQRPWGWYVQERRQRWPEHSDQGGGGYKLRLER